MSCITRKQIAPPVTVAVGCIVRGPAVGSGSLSADVSVLALHECEDAAEAFLRTAEVGIMSRRLGSAGTRR